MTNYNQNLSNVKTIHKTSPLLTARLVLAATLAALLASLYDATAQSYPSPQIQVTGSAVGGEIYYLDQSPYSNQVSVTTK